MGVERQQGSVYQLSLFEGEEGALRHGAGGTRTAACEEVQRPTVRLGRKRKRALAWGIERYTQLNQ